jgi:hypothetical protein
MTEFSAINKRLPAQPDGCYNAPGSDLCGMVQRQVDLARIKAAIEALRLKGWTPQDFAELLKGSFVDTHT